MQEQAVQEEAAPSPEQQSNPTLELPPISAGEATIEACSFHADQEDRVALHHRDENSGTCMDLILVRVGKGGIVPAAVVLPWDWGVGHMSSYLCGPDGKIAEGASATPITQVFGSVGMEGGRIGLPASVSLDLTMTGPGSGTQAARSYAWHTQGLDVSASCDAPRRWATQSLNVNAKPPAIQWTGCKYSGGYDRLIIRQRDESTSICSELRLVDSFGEEGYGTVPPGLSVPENWAVEYMYSFHCGPANASRPEQPHYYSYFTAAQGSVSFGASEERALQYVWLDVSMSAPEPGDDVPAEFRIESQRIASSDTIVVGAVCSLDLW